MSNGGETIAAREINLEAVRTDQQNLSNSLSEVNAVCNSITEHLNGGILKERGLDNPKSDRPTPPGILGQMCELGHDNQQGLNRIMGTLQQISHLVGAS